MLNLLWNWCPRLLYRGFLVAPVQLGLGNGATTTRCCTSRRSRWRCCIAKFSLSFVRVLLRQFGDMMLSRLGFLQRKHTSAVDPSNVEELLVHIIFVVINRRLLIFRVSEEIEAENCQRLT